MAELRWSCSNFASPVLLMMVWGWRLELPPQAKENSELMGWPKEKHWVLLPEMDSM
jgi:hypothetical protein